MTAPVGDSNADRLREALAVIHAWDDDDHGTYLDLAKRFAVYAERRARERAAEELRAAADDRHGEQCCGGPCADDLRDRADSLAADDRAGQR